VLRAVAPGAQGVAGLDLAAAVDAAVDAASDAGGAR